MALIKCPECGKEISDQAKQCIHCGFPLESLVKEAGGEVLYAVTLERLLMSSQYVTMKAGAIACLQDLLGITTSEADTILTHLPIKIADGIKKEYLEEIERMFTECGCRISFSPGNARVLHPANEVMEQKRAEKNAQRICPKCAAEAEEIVKDSLFGGRKTEYHCHSCGHRWKKRS